MKWKINNVAVIALAIGIVAILAVALLGTAGSILPPPEVKDMPDVEDGAPIYKYVQASGIPAKNGIPGTTEFYFCLNHVETQVVDTLPTPPLWMAKATRGNDVKVVVHLIAPDGTSAAQEMTFGYASLVSKTPNQPQDAIPAVALGGWFAVSGPGTYTLHLDLYELSNGVWVESVSNVDNGDGFYDISVEVA